MVSGLPTFAGAATHKVKPGDTLWEIAAKHHTTPKAIAKANGIRENATLALGRNIVVPGKSTARKHYTSKHNYTAKRVVARSVSRIVHTNVDSACLRSGPNTNSRKVTVLAKGTSGKVLACKGKWAKIALANGTCGYVYRPLIAPGSGTVSAQTTAATPPKVAPAPTPVRSDATSLVRTALAYRGSPYRRGGTSRGGFDCSGFTRYIYAKYGVSLPHSSAAQAHYGTPVSKSELREGDLLFFHTRRGGISHVGIYAGNGQFVHAATYGRGVRVDSINSGYYASRYRGARRIK